MKGTGSFVMDTVLLIWLGVLLGKYVPICLRYIQRLIRRRLIPEKGGASVE